MIELFCPDMVRSRHWRQALTKDFLTFYMSIGLVLGHRLPDTDIHWSKIGKRVGNLHEILDYCQSWDPTAMSISAPRLSPGKLDYIYRFENCKADKMWIATQIKSIALHRISLDFSTLNVWGDAASAPGNIGPTFDIATSSEVRCNTQNFEKTIFLGGRLGLTHLYCLGVTTAVQIWAVAPLIIADAVFVFLL